MLLFHKIVFPTFCWGFLAENQMRNKIAKIVKHDEKTEYFEEEKAFILLKGISNRIEGRKVSR